MQRAISVSARIARPTGAAPRYTGAVTDIIDLSHVIADGTVTYPGLPAPVISDHLGRAESRERYAPGYEFQIGRIDMVANTGTYLDTPFHRFADGHDLAGLDLARVAGVPGVLVDATAGQAATAALLDDVDVAGRAVLVRTGWDLHWGTPRYGEPDHPFLAVDAAERLVEAGAAVVGIDSVNIDDTRTGERPIHTLLLGAGIPIVEHLRGLEALGARPFRFFAVPPAVAGMGTFPVRAFAVAEG
jgi:kynurenine formamidase